MCYPYIESATVLSDYYVEDFTRISDFLRAAGPRMVSVDLKYDVLCLRVFVHCIST